MRTFPLFALLFFAVPLLEIYFLIQVGGVIGALPTIILVVLTAVIGAFLLRQQGLSTMSRFQRSMSEGQMPATALLEGVMLLVGGLLLMTPGFFTDAVGFACLIPYSRQWLARRLVKRFHVVQHGDHTGFGGSPYSENVHVEQTQSQNGSRGNTVLDGDYVRKD